MNVQETASGRPSPPRTALLIEPDTDTRDLYALALERDQWIVSVAADGAEGVDRAIATRPDVVVTEVSMPLVDGFELCRRLKRDSATAAIPVVVVTACACPAEVDRAEEAGGDVVVCKPCLPTELVDLLNRVLERSLELRAESTEVRSRALKALRHSQDGPARAQRRDGSAPR